ncbi:MAG: hypothetical protein DI535_11225 [Citrobacter freundii]|nr:MAG: hypothetical protein DI535_11225 [Citrobacter freundii]
MSPNTFAAVNPRYFLNKLALHHSINSLSVEPLNVIVRLFAKRPYPEMLELFEDFCEAAVAPAFCWKKTPGELLGFAEELEQLIEACYLLYRNRRSTPSASAQLKPLKDFFHTFSLPDWKRILHEWTRAALSPNSIAESGKPMEMIPFVRGMEELMKSGSDLPASF